MAIDDFGAAYSGLNLLADFPCSLVKLDMDLTRNIDERPAPRAIVKAMVKLAEELDSRVVAEGIETVAEYWALRECGVTLMQGYLLAKPMFEGLPEVTIPQFGSYVAVGERAEAGTEVSGAAVSGLVRIKAGLAA